MAVIRFKPCSSYKTEQEQIIYHLTCIKVLSMRKNDTFQVCQGNEDSTRLLSQHRVERIRRMLD